MLISKSAHYPSVAVLLTVHNGAKWLIEQVESILAQNDVELRIFISIDESSDGSEHICNELCQNYRKITLLPKGGRFGSAAANFFRLIRDVDITNFEYISFADQDDIWLNNKLSVAISCLKKSNSDAYSSNVTAFWSDRKTKLIDKSQPQKMFDYMFESAGPGCTFVINHELALKIQSHLITHYEQSISVELHDWFIYAFARYNGCVWFIDKQSFMLYRQHDQNVVGANVGLQSAINRWNRLRDGWFVFQAINIAKLAGYDNLWPIQSLSRLALMDKLKVAINCGKFRRKLRDQIAFCLAILLISKT